MQMGVQSFTIIKIVESIYYERYNALEKRAKNVAGTEDNRE